MIPSFNTCNISTYSSRNELFELSPLLAFSDIFCDRELLTAVWVKISSSLKPEERLKFNPLTEAIRSPNESNMFFKYWCVLFINRHAYW